MAAAETAPALANELGGWFEAEFGPRADRWRSADYYVLLSRDGQLAERLGLLDSNPSHETSLSFIVEFRALRTVDPVRRSARDALIAEVGLSEEEVPSRRTRAPGRRELYRSVRDCRLTARDQLAKKLVSLIHDVEVHHRRAKGHRLGSRRRESSSNQLATLEAKSASPFLAFSRSILPKTSSGHLGGAKRVNASSIFSRLSIAAFESKRPSSGVLEVRSNGMNTPLVSVRLRLIGSC
jgi:hypothetical protein